MNKVNYLKFLRISGVILFIYILFRIDLGELAAVFKKINLAYYLTGFSFLIFWVLARTLKWKKLADSVGAKIPAGILLQIMAKGVFLGVITPAKIGEFWRAKYLSDSAAISKGRAFYTAFIDRLMDLLVIVFVAVIGLPIIYLRFGAGVSWQLYVLAIVFLIILSFVFFQKIGLRGIFKLFAKFFVPASWQGKTDAFLSDFDSSFKALKLSVFLETMAYSFFHYLVAVTAYYFFALALGINIQFLYLFLVVAIIWLILAIPITFLGLGTREAGFIYFFAIIGVSSSFGVALSLLVLFSNILLSVPGAILFLNPKQNHGK
ncbi:MAG: lysylphosphatidylglycerol synthase transmembrane domain-containing protein [Candidatus Nealsonbacteria bacterium]